MSKAARDAFRAESRAAFRAETIGAAEARMAVADDPVTVVAEALALVDLLAPTLPLGGGLAARGAALPYAEAAVEALRLYPKGIPAHARL